MRLAGNFTRRESPQRRARRQRVDEETRFLVYVPVSACRRAAMLDYVAPRDASARIVEDYFFSENRFDTQQYGTPFPNWNTVPAMHDDAQIDGVIWREGMRKPVLAEFKLASKVAHNHELAFRVHLSAHQMGILGTAKNIVDTGVDARLAQRRGHLRSTPARFHSGGLAIGNKDRATGHVKMYYVKHEDLVPYWEEAQRAPDRIIS